jgi:putative ABC transport system permease protein
MNRPSSAPRLAEWIVRLVVRDPIAREGLIGDLEEEHGACGQASPLAARLRYWRAALQIAVRYGRDRLTTHLKPPPVRPPAPRRGDSPMHSFLQGLRFATRSLAKSWGFTSLAVATLAIGIGASTAMFGILEAVLLVPLPYEEPDRLVLARTTFGGRVNTTTSAPDYEDYRARGDAFELLAVMFYSPVTMTLTGAQEAQRVETQWVSFDLFRTLGVDPVAGRHFRSDEERLEAPDVAIVSHAFWQQALGGREAAFGETLVLDGTAHTVVGVMPPGFRFYHDVDVWLTYRPGSPYARGREYHNFVPIGRLADGVAMAQAQGQVDAIAANLRAEYPETNENKGLLLIPLHEAMVSGARESMVMLGVAVGLLLLIACANVANLLLAKGAPRGAELAVRAALGAGRARLVRQLLTESLVIAVLAGLVGAALSVALQRVILDVVPVPALGVAEAGLSPSMLAFAVLAAVTTSLLFGSVPALSATPVELAGQLKGGARGGASRGARRLRGALVVAQVALSVVLLIGAGLLVRSFFTLSAVDLGFDDQRLLAAEVRLPAGEYEGERQEAFFASLRERVAALPGVAGVGLVNQLPVRDPGNNIGVSDARIEALEPGDAPLAYSRVVFPGYFETMGIGLVAGRDVDAADRAGSPPVVVINETMASRLFAGESPLGQRIRIGQSSDSHEVVGVVGDVLMDGPAYGAQPAFYRPYAQAPQRTMRLAVRTAGEPAAVGPSLRAAIVGLDPDIPVQDQDLETMSSIMARTRAVAQSRLAARSLGLFAVVALVLAGVGLYGVLAQYVSQRSREIGVRMALGARPLAVSRLILTHGLLLVGAGLLLGLAASLAGNRLLAQRLYGVAPSDPIAHLGSAAFLLLVALVACLVPVWRAVRVDPLVTLRAE